MCNSLILPNELNQMAPEIALKEPYDKEADVFSFTMLLWEILSMEVMYPSYTIKDYFVRVCKQNERPPIPSNKSWPPVMKALVQEGWDRNPQKRPTMKRVGMLIRGLLSDMSSGDDGIVNRSTHMMDKSRRSLHNNLVTGDDPMMDSSSGRRRAGRRSDRASGLGTNTTGKASAGVHASGRMRESFHQNFDTSELD
jgi:Protein tyrosine and serine/threonine kinase